MKGFENLYHEFTDDQGRKYYVFAPGTIPFVRYQQQKEFLRWVEIGQSEDEYRKLNDYGSQALTMGVNGLTTIAKVFQEQEFRINVIRPQLIYQLMAVTIVREDEDPLAYSREIQDEKAKLIEEDMSSLSMSDPDKGMEFFFALKPLMPLFLKSPHTREHWQNILRSWEQEENRRKSTNQALESNVSAILMQI